MSVYVKRFQDFVNKIDDKEMLDKAEEVLREMVAIENLKQKVQQMEDKLLEGDSSLIWSFACNIEPELISMATNTVLGRRRVVIEKEAAAKADRERARGLSQSKSDAQPAPQDVSDEDELDDDDDLDEDDDENDSSLV